MNDFIQVLITFLSYSSHSVEMIHTFLYFFSLLFSGSRCIHQTPGIGTEFRFDQRIQHSGHDEGTVGFPGKVGRRIQSSMFFWHCQCCRAVLAQSQVAH